MKRRAAEPSFAPGQRVCFDARGFEPDCIGPRGPLMPVELIEAQADGWWLVMLTEGPRYGGCVSVPPARLARRYEDLLAPDSASGMGFQPVADSGCGMGFQPVPDSGCGMGFQPVRDSGVRDAAFLDGPPAPVSDSPGDAGIVTLGTGSKTGSRRGQARDCAARRLSTQLSLFAEAGA